MYIDVHVQPGARRPRVVGRHGDALKVAVATRPVGGHANETVVRALAELLGIPTSEVSLVAGQTSRHKRLFAKGVNLREARLRIDSALSE